jgi:hypothetical protein
MATMPHNIERSYFRKGELIGYGAGLWRIRRYGKPGTQTAWRAALTPAGNPDGVARAEVYGDTLAKISAHINAYATASK